MNEPEDLTGRRNMQQLVELRWLAVAGQVVTIAVASAVFGIALPLGPMAIVLACLIGLNIAGMLRVRTAGSITNGEMFLALLLDVAALTAQLYLSGGATNPFTSLYLLQVILGAVLLDAWSTWVMVTLTGVCFAALTVFYVPLQLPPRRHGDLFGMHIFGMLICFLLDATLLAFFIARIMRNLRARDAHLADLRQQSAEQDHIVRMGLLASGAAHELGTPLATLSVILNDWQRRPALASDPEMAEERDEMEAELMRCKAIVTGILLSAGEARGEAPAATTMRAFLDDIVQDWRATRATADIIYENAFGEDMPVVSDSALRQVIGNVLDNAAEASPGGIVLRATRDGGTVVLEVSDNGPGFAPDMLANFGKPYNSSKGRLGGGLGLFLVVNVVRKLGGTVSARNRPGGGAVVTLTLPLSALTIGTAHAI